jgi:hypothetical protein
VVDGSDFLLWQRHANPQAGETIRAVPEPDCVILAAIFFLQLLAVGIRR